MTRAATLRTRLATLLAAVGAGLGSYLLIDQGITTIGNRLTLGDSWPAAVIHYLSFLSILSNAALVAVYVWFLSAGRVMRWARPATLHAFLVALIVLVGLVWHVLLAPDEGLSFSNVGLHYLTPALFVAWWLVRSHDDAAQVRPVHTLMLAPLAYAGWILARGAVTGAYPYPFINVDQVGWAATLQMMSGLLVALWLLALALVVVDRWRVSRSAP